jgi:hypothetical protein
MMVTMEIPSKIGPTVFAAEPGEHYVKSSCFAGRPSSPSGPFTRNSRYCPQGHAGARAVRRLRITPRGTPGSPSRPLRLWHRRRRRCRHGSAESVLQAVACGSISCALRSSVLLPLVVAVGSDAQAASSCFAIAASFCVRRSALSGCTSWAATNICKSYS